MHYREAHASRSPWPCNWNILLIAVLNWETHDVDRYWLLTSNDLRLLPPR